MKNTIKTAIGGLSIAVAAAAGIAIGAPANATPPCQTNWELKSDGMCHPYYSTGGLGAGQYCYPDPDPNADSYLKCVDWSG